MFVVFKCVDILRRSPCASRSLWVAAAAGWMLLIGWGMNTLWAHQNTPGPAATAPARWPVSSSIKPEPGKPTLVLLAHPQCPCTKATLAELAVLMTRCQGRLAACVLFIKPTGMPDRWEKTDLWRDAAAIPGVTVSADPDAGESKLFGARTSGQALLYSPDGRLVYSGGLTISRAHHGDNPGLSALSRWVNSGDADRQAWPVFGCPLDTPAKD
jgi:hypothetical protein